MFAALPLKGPAVVLSTREVNSGNMPSMIEQEGYRKHQGFIGVASPKNHVTVTMEESSSFEKKIL